MLLTALTDVQARGRREGLEEAAHEMCRVAQDPEMFSEVKEFAASMENDYKRRATAIRSRT